MPRPVARWIWLLTGIAWGSRAMIGLAQPQYADAITLIDKAAVWSYSVAWLLLAPSVVLLARLTSARGAIVISVVCAVAAIVAGSANGLEDGLGLRPFGIAYVAGVLVAWLCLPALAVACARAGWSRLAPLCVGLFVGILFVSSGGGLIVLGCLGAIALAPAWFIRPIGSTALEAAA